MPEHIALRREHKWQKLEVNHANSSIVIIIGFGSIGISCAKMLRGNLGCKVIGVKLSESEPSQI